MSKFNDLYNLIMEEILNENAILFEDTIITEATEQVTQVVRFLYTCSQTRDLIEAALDNINDNIMKPFINVTCFQQEMIIVIFIQNYIDMLYMDILLENVYMIYFLLLKCINHY